ncbi:hypothetical protein [Stakelama tenebrarum]|uniref:Uncharacterized protein n=1 Tax=Stakelama tenebrarum TaxID=2711215 RepID=A0A6G6YA83_9SPHN|nr:hypothetical protein [Sphingosinithalassobacter tenebrarum]QIG81486.1 hypothetical protein G5C33_17970 [Sphingosinithalassobacter tenebrarum]
MFALLAAIALTGAAPSDDPYPAEAVFAAVRAACGDVQDYAATQAAVRAQGWEAYEPEEGSPQRTFLDHAQLFVDNFGDMVSHREGHVFRATIAGEALDLVVSRVEGGGRWVNGCAVFDAAEARSLPIAFFTEKLGAAPYERADVPGAMRKAFWQPGLAPTHLNFEYYYVPADSPGVPMLGSGGMGFIAQASGELNG